MSLSAQDVQRSLTDVKTLCRALQLDDGAKSQASGLLIRCPAHTERDPSCSVTVGPDGTIRVKCFACDFSTNAIGLIAKVRGLSLREAEDFRQVLAEGADIAGLADSGPGGRPVDPPIPREATHYPVQSDVTDLWQRAILPGDDIEASSYLVRRRIDPVAIGERGLARVIVPPVPGWASYQARSWTETGHRLVVRVFDPGGRHRSVRAIRVRDNDTPKRLPPAGKKAAGLCMVNRSAHDMLRGAALPRVIFVEGEPDFLTTATVMNEPVIGIVSGSWTEDFAKTIQSGCRVVIRTHNDPAGDRYAEHIMSTIGARCDFRRSEPIYA